MVLVDYGGGLWSAGLGHSPWDGVTFADFIFPAFLFMVGISLAIACRVGFFSELQLSSSIRYFG